MVNYVIINEKKIDVNYADKSLSISGQNITDTNEIKNLDKLTYLEKLFLQNNKISEIKDLNLLINLKVLYLSGNKISEIKGLDNLVNLEHLYLNDNEIYKIEGLANCKNLKSLNLEGNHMNKIQNLDINIKLETLFLGNNKISEISGLKNLIELKYLGLENNQNISKIEGLENLDNLGTLGLENTKIPTELIEKLGGLNTEIPSRVAYPLNFVLYCRAEYIEYEDQLIFINQNRLNLSGYNISNLHDLKHLEKVDKVEHLNLVDNYIKKLNNLDYFVNLKTLWGSFNEIEKIENLDHLKKLEELSLNNNKITDSSGLRPLISLRKLNLKENNIKNISEIKYLENLVELNLSGNTEISDFSEILNLPSLKILILEKMDLNTIPNFNLKNLKELYINDNKIVEIPKVYLPKLKFLDLGNNQLKSMVNLCQFPYLIRLNLNNNQIKKLECIDKMSNNLNIFSIDKNKIDKRLFDKLWSGDFKLNSRFFIFYLILRKYLNDQSILTEINFDQLIGDSPVLNSLKKMGDHSKIRDIVKLFNNEFEILCGRNKVPLKIITPKYIAREIDILLEVVGPDEGYGLEHIVDRLQLCSKKALVRLLRRIRSKKLWNIEFYYNETHIKRATNFKVKTTQLEFPKINSRMNFKNQITWLHFSDLNFTEIKESDSKIMKSRLKFLESLIIKSRKKIDLLFITGDVTTSGKPKEFTNFANYLEDIISTLNLERENVFIVPGNHDKHQTEFFQPFENFLNSFYKGEKSYEKENSYFVEEKYVNNCLIGVLGLNSSMFDINHLKLCLKTYKDHQYSNPDINICLFHRSLENHMVSEEIKNLIYDNFDFILNGHLHKSIKIMRSNGLNHNVIQFIAGSMNLNIVEYNYLRREGEASFYDYSTNEQFWKKDTTTGFETGKIEFETIEYDIKKNHIRSVHARDIGLFKELNVEFNQKFNFLIGPNASGKTSILKCIALSFSITSDSLKHFRYGSRAELWTNFYYEDKKYNVGSSVGFVQNGEIYRKSEVASLQLPLGEGIQMNPRDLEKKDINFIPLSINAYRRIYYIEIEGSKKEKKLNPTRNKYKNRAVSNLAGEDFGPISSYPSVKQWMVNRILQINLDWADIEKQNWSWFIQNLSEIGPSGTNLSFIDIDKENNPIFKLFNKSCYLEELSAGFQAVLYLICNIINWIETGNYDKGRKLVRHTTGTVLIDELDVHLHPEWQFSIRHTLEKFFPNLQFIVTTHSPHLISTAEKNEIIYLKEFNRIINIKPLQKTFSGWTTDQILKDLMGVESLENKLYNKLIKQANEFILKKEIKNLKKIIKELDLITHKSDIIVQSLKIRLVNLQNNLEP